MHADGDREWFGQAGWASDDASGVGIEELDPPYVLFGCAVPGRRLGPGVRDQMPF